MTSVIFRIEIMMEEIETVQVTVILTSLITAYVMRYARVRRVTMICQTVHVHAPPSN